MKALVTGGAGFVGAHIVRILREQGHEVVFLARGDHAAFATETGATQLRGDIQQLADCKAAVAGADVVFHVAAKAGAWGDREVFWGINVDGTQNMLDASREAGVAKFIYTSTPSVVGSSGDTLDTPQDAPYATEFASAYGETKCEAEKRVLAANGPELATVALRPSLIVGPGDPHLMPRFMDGHKRGKLRQIGDGHNVVDFTVVDNAAWAHIDAAAALTDHTAACAGKAYFISNGEPVKLWSWFSDLAEETGLGRVEKTISRGAALRIFSLVEWVYRVFSLGEPMVTRWIAEALSVSRTYDIEPAKRDLGYTIRVPLADTLVPTAAYLREL
jgi:nucleoside-diphosphate-sugar epimerase